MICCFGVCTTVASAARGEVWRAFDTQPLQPVANATICVVNMGPDLFTLPVVGKWVILGVGIAAEESLVL